MKLSLTSQQSSPAIEKPYLILFYLERLFSEFIMSFPRPKPFLGLTEDLQARLPLYISDYEHWANIKLYASVLFMFFTSIGPAITFSSLLRTETDDNIGVIEVLLSSALTGIIMGLFSGQPLVIVGVTGPVSILTSSIYSMSNSWGIKFLPFYAWCQIWGALLHMLFSIFNGCDMVLWITRFSGEIFGVLIAVIYLYRGIADMLIAFTDKSATFETGLLSLVVSLGVCWCAMQLYAAKDWKVFSTKIRENISDYGASIALILWTGLVYLPGPRGVDIGVYMNKLLIDVDIL